jgi:hypothetical protein
MCAVRLIAVRSLLAAPPALHSTRYEGLPERLVRLNAWSRMTDQ